MKITSNSAGLVFQNRQKLWDFGNLKCNLSCQILFYDEP